MTPFIQQARCTLAHPPTPKPSATESVEAFWLRIANRDIHQCPHCRVGRMLVISAIRAAASPITGVPRPP